MNLRKKFDRFCFQNRDKGIPNLMLYICIGSAIVYLFSTVSNNYVLYDFLRFDLQLIFKGQVWRLFSYVLTMQNGNILLTLLLLVCYYSLGRAMENIWGTLRFNLFYLTGVVMMDIYALVIGLLMPQWQDYMSFAVDVSYLNMSLFLGYATLYPDAHFLLFFIIPVKAWIFALIDLLIVVFGLISYPFPVNLFSVISLANYFLFFGKDVLNILPMSWRANARRLFRKNPKKTGGNSGPKVVPFPKAGSYEASSATVKAPYNHKCTVCGRTDASNPELEFRYCSRCNGYHCYCEDHIRDHQHIE